MYAFVLQNLTIHGESYLLKGTKVHRATFTQVEATVQTISDAMNVINAEINLLKAAAGYPPGISPNREDHKTRSIMEQKVIQNVDKLTNSPADYFIWSLRFKTAMSQVNPKYKELLEDGYSDRYKD